MKKKSLWPKKNTFPANPIGFNSIEMTPYGIRIRNKIN